jgi:iron complex transport system substrate-binding protein
MISLKDQMGRTLELENPPKRIVSLVPSQTELLSYFGLEKEVVGITKFCIHPKDWFHSKMRVGGTKNITIQKVVDLKPDLIIANKEENTKEDIELLQEVAPVYVSDINTVEDALGMMKDIGLLTRKEQLAVDLIDEIQEDFEHFPSYSGSVLYLIWRDPYMVCGTDNFISAILKKIGFNNVIESPRYREISKEEIMEMNPDYIFLSSEPYPFSEDHLVEFKELSDAKIVLVDGEMFSWYGSRMLKMKKYFSATFGN